MGKPAKSNYFATVQCGERKYHNNDLPSGLYKVKEVQKKFK